MPTSRNDVLKESAFATTANSSVSHGRRFRANIIIWGMRKHYSTLIWGMRKHYSTLFTKYITIIATLRY